jgi:lysophospholipase L1-like esterase
MRSFDENIIGMQEEGDASWWNPSIAGQSGTLTSADSWVTVAGPAQTTFHRCCCPPDFDDFILYVKVKAEHASGVSTFLSMRNATNNYRISIGLGYSWVSGTQTMGKVGLIANGGTTKFDIESAYDYEAEAVELAIHCDRNRNAISVYKRASGQWVYVSHIPSSTLLNDVSRLALGVNNGSANGWISLDYALCCRPNMVAIGDSICAGRTLFDPNPSVLGGNDNNASTWMRHAALAPSNRNNLVVNKGVGGNTSAQLAARIAEATAHKPRVVFLHASANDEQASVPQATRTANIQSAVNAIVASGADCYLLNGTYANANYAAHPNHALYMDAWWGTNLAAITGLAGSVDIMTALEDSTGVLASTLAQADGIHPNVAGYTAMGTLICSCV